MNYGQMLRPNSNFRDVAVADKEEDPCTGYYSLQLQGTKFCLRKRTKSKIALQACENASHSPCP